LINISEHCLSNAYSVPKLSGTISSEIIVSYSIKPIQVLDAFMKIITQKYEEYFAMKYVNAQNIQQVKQTDGDK
jgi:hypothetical protein